MTDYQPLTWTLGDRLAKTLKDADLDISKMAWLLRRHRNSVSKWLKNDGPEPDTHTLIQWATALADNSELDRDTVLAFLQVTPEQVAADRRQVERRGGRRGPPHKAPEQPQKLPRKVPHLPADGSPWNPLIDIQASPIGVLKMGTRVETHAGRNIVVEYAYLDYGSSEMEEIPAEANVIPVPRKTDVTVPLDLVA